MESAVQVPKLTLAKLGELDKQVRRAADPEPEAGGGAAGTGKEGGAVTGKEGSAKDSGGGHATSHAPASATEVAAPLAVRGTAAPLSAVAHLLAGRSEQPLMARFHKGTRRCCLWEGAAGGA